jgi:hypothetical protein
MRALKKSLVLKKLFYKKNGGPENRPYESALHHLPEYGKKNRGCFQY